MILAFLKQNVGRGFTLSQRMSSTASLTDFMKRKESLNNEFQGVVKSIGTSPQFSKLPNMARHMENLLAYNTSGGKCIRGLLTVMTYEMMAEPENITEESLKLSRIMGWCVEMLHAIWIIVDDIVDRSETRRGKPSWHALPNVRMNAINDSIIIYGCMWQLLNSNFRHLPRYVSIVELMNEAMLSTAIGQHMDYEMSNENQRNYNHFTPERFNEIAKYKTTDYTFNLPVCLGMNLANICDKETFRKTNEICYKIGRLYQIQNDFKDCYVSATETGKTGNDIEEGKCTWLAVTALQRCNEAQRKIFTTYYNSPEPEHVEQIKSLYRQLDILEMYRQEENKEFDEIIKLAYEFNASSRAPELFMKLLDIFFKRTA